MSDLRAAILARCAELEQLARDCCDFAGGTPHWTAQLAAGDSLAVELRPILTVLPPEHSPHRMVMGETLATFPIGGIGYLLGNFDPATVLELVAGAREMCELHAPEDDPYAYSFCKLPAVEERDCRGCGFRASGDYPLHKIGDCPSLRATAKMLRVKVTA